MSRDIIFWKKLYKAFDPFRPLPANDPTWVDCRDVRGDEDIITGLGTEILRSESFTCQLYAGHRGGGKSTELLRLQDHLQNQEYQVIYFAADDNDVEPIDTGYSDILLACAKHLIDTLKQKAENKKQDWKQWWKDLTLWKDWLGNLTKFLKDLQLPEIEVNEFTYETPETVLGKLATTIKSNPNKRQEIRRRLEENADSLIDILNEFIKKALGQQSSEKLVLMVDNLDRIIERYDTNTQSSNYQQIFVHHSDHLRKLACHVIYTVPISLVYSPLATTLEERYKPAEVLPMIMVKNPEGYNHDAGIEILKTMIKRRAKSADNNLELNQLFTDDGLTNLCLMSGGHVRNLMALMKAALQYTNNDELPISNKAVTRAISEVRQTYKRAIEEDDWETLARVHSDKQKRTIMNNDKQRKLLFSRCILEYRVLNEEWVLDTWRDVHPLILALESFKEAVEKLDSQS